MNGNIRVGSLFGIPFFLNASWFFVLALVTLNFGNGLAAQFPGLGLAALGLGLVAGLLMFASVLLHELGHSVAAQQRGITVNSITLFLFGGLASLNEEAKTPAGTFWIAVAGPLVSILLFVMLSLVAISGLVSGAIAAVISLLASINLALAVFNMIPGLPLDGGNALKAIVWKLTGNRFRGTRWASLIGQGIGWVGIVLGVLSILGISNAGSFWSLIIGWFLLRNAGQAAQSASIQERLSQLTAADAVIQESPIIDANSSLRALANEAIAARPIHQWRRFLVKDDAFQLLGTIDLDVLDGIPTSQWSDHRVEDYLQPLTPGNQVTSNQSLLDVIAKLEKQGCQSFAVIRENGTLMGLLEKSAILRLLQEPPLSQPA